jgi:acetyl-CoA hydrolase
MDDYRAKLGSAEEAVKVVASGMKVFVHSGCAVPQVLLDALMKRSDEISDVEISHILHMGEAAYVGPEMLGRFRHRSFFTGRNVREAVNAGRAEHVPIFLSEVPLLFRRGAFPVDVAFISLSPPDEHGFCSFGVDVGVNKAAAETARYVVAQVNSRMPRTLGDSFIHVHKLHRVVETEQELPELPRLRMTDSVAAIGENVAGLIEDGSTLQLGIGAIPDAVLHYLRGRKDLGVHTEMFSDGIVELIEEGIINNEKKTIHPGKTVVGFVLGTRWLFDYIDNNPRFEFHPTEYVNDPFIIAQNDKMISINSAIEVDLTGQVCADSIGYKIFSGIGGQVDFIRGAARSAGGKPIIALESTARDGEVSRIVPALKEGAGVVTSRGDVHYVVTEYGVTNLHGKSIRERTRALISLAHPEFRDDLSRTARELHYL